MTRGEQHLVETWRQAASDSRVAREIETTFAMIAGEIAARAPSCWASGRCCHFSRAGHRLYATGLEAAYTFTRRATRLTGDELQCATSVGGCPFQQANLCSVHGIKPIGCRVYFCDTTLDDWVEDLANRMHRRIAEVHSQYDVPYHYAEWRTLLRMFTDSESGPASRTP